MRPLDKRDGISQVVGGLEGFDFDFEFVLEECFEFVEDGAVGVVESGARVLSFEHLAEVEEGYASGVVWVFEDGADELL